MWAKVKGSCFHSLTIAWTYVLGVAGEVLNNLDAVGDIVSDPTLKDQVAQAFGTNPGVLGKVMLGIAAVNFIARMRGVMKKVQ